MGILSILLIMFGISCRNRTIFLIMSKLSNILSWSIGKVVTPRFAFHFHTSSTITTLASILQYIEDFFIAKVLCAFLFIRNGSHTLIFTVCVCVCCRHRRLIFSLLQSIFYNAITKNILGDGERYYPENVYYSVSAERI